MRTDKLRYRWDRAAAKLRWQWERVWLCRTRGEHMEKYSSDGRCIRCHRRLR